MKFVNNGFTGDSGYNGDEVRGRVRLILTNTDPVNAGTFTISDRPSDPLPIVVQAAASFFWSAVLDSTMVRRVSATGLSTGMNIAILQNEVMEDE